MRSADVVIVGAGVIGASIAHHLAIRGCTNVLVLDRFAALGEGSTGRATGGFRAQFGSEVNIRLSLLSREKLARFQDETGVDPGYRPVGYLFIASRPPELERLLQACSLQRSVGLLEVEHLDPQRVREVNGAVESPIEGAVFCPTDGYIRPLEILRGYTESAHRLGVRFEYATSCVGMDLVRQRIIAVRAPSGVIPTESVVNASGAWAAKVAAYAGVSLPVRPLRRQVAVTHPSSLLPDDMPMTIFVEDGFHLRVRDGRILLLLPDPSATEDSFDTTVEDDWIHAVLQRAHERLPILRKATIDRPNCWAGLYEMSPDSHAILGLAEGVENFFLANGSSGHGVMHAPAIGQLMSELILDGRASSLDIRSLRPSRFGEGDLVGTGALL